MGRFFPINGLAQIEGAEQGHSKRVNIGLLEISLSLDKEFRRSEIVRGPDLVGCVSLFPDAIAKAPQLVAALLSGVEHIAGPDVIMGDLRTVQNRQGVDQIGGQSIELIHSPRPVVFAAVLDDLG